MKKFLCACALTALFFGAAQAADSVMLDDCSQNTGWTFNNKPVEFVADGAGKALKVTVPGNTFRGKLSHVSGNWHLNNMKGISLEVKGDGSEFYFPLVLNGFGSNRGWKYTAYVHVKGSDWQTVTIGFDRFTGPSGSVYWDFGMPGTFGAGSIDGITFGDKWNITHCNRKLAKKSFLVRNIKLVSKVEPYVMKSYPVKKVSDVIAKMKAGKKVSIICTGDSITAGTSVKDPDLNRYGVKLQKKLRKAFKNNNINVEVVAVGGARTFDLRVWAERDFAGKDVDLVTIMIGYNDKSSQSAPDYYYGSLSRAVDRILNVANGKPAILLLPPIPGQGARYNMMDDYAETCKRLARDRKLEYFEMAPAFKKLPLETFTSYFADMAHPNADGHEFIAQQIAGYLAR